jgi:hypothetical protein
VLYQLSYLAATLDPSVSGTSGERCEPDRRPLLGRADGGEFETWPADPGVRVTWPGFSESSARVYGVDERMDDFDCFVEVGMSRLLAMVLWRSLQPG